MPFLNVPCYQIDYDAILYYAKENDREITKTSYTYATGL